MGAPVAWAPGWNRRRGRYGGHHGQLYRALGGASRVAGTGRVECGRRWPLWCASDYRGGGRRGPRLGAQGAGNAGTRPQARGARTGGRSRADARGCAAAVGRQHHPLFAGRECEYRGL